jgi:hypothetical protein
MSRLIAVLAVLSLGAFLGVLIWRVPHLDLVVVLTVGFLLAAFDVLTSAWRNRSRNGGQGDPPV